MGYFHYFVEGQTDEKMVSNLKTELQYIQSGKIDVINVVTQEISKSRIMKLKRDTTVILVFDTDRAETEVLYKNIKFLRKQKEIVSSIICVPQCKNLEDEIIRSCNIRSIKDLTDSKSNKEFKKDFLHITNSNAVKKLVNKQFDMRLFWTQAPSVQFENIKNSSQKIKFYESISKLNSSSKICKYGDS